MVTYVRKYGYASCPAFGVSAKIVVDIFREKKGLTVAIYKCVRQLKFIHFSQIATETGIATMNIPNCGTLAAEDKVAVGSLCVTAVCRFSICC